MDLINTIAAIPGIGPALPYVILLIVICAFLGTVVPPPATAGSGIYAVFYSIVNGFALNFGHARNATAPSPAPVAGMPPKVFAGVAVGLAAAGLTLAACTPAEQTQLQASGTTFAAVAAAHNTTVASLITKGALFCQKNEPVIATAAGAAEVVAVATGQGVAASVIGQSAQAVAATCAVLNAVPVPAPAAASTVPVVTVPTTTLPPVTS